MIKKGLNQGAHSLSPRWTKVATAVTIALTAAMPSQAIDISWGDWEGSFDSTLSAGISWRAEKRDFNLIGHTKDPSNVALDPNGIPFVPLQNRVGSYSNNGDDGNLNFHQWDSFSKVFKGSHDFGMQHSSGFGFFARGTWFYDAEIKDDDRRFRAIAEESKDIQGSDARILDAYIYHTFEFEESVLQLRLGEQVINWGESTFIQHSISEANALDATKLRVPGSELKEAFIPVQTLWGSFDLTENLTLEAYIQFEWEHVRLDEAGTYFSTTDYAGEYRANEQYISLGFGIRPEDDPFTNDFNPLTTADDESFGNRALRLDDRDARDDGQFGIKLGWYSPELNDTEFGFYYINYHNRRPVITANAYSIVPVGAANYTGVTGFFEYIEDIELYGISFNTSTDSGLSIAGELSYRIDEPLQIDDVEILFKTLEPIGAVPPGTSQIAGSPNMGDEISGYRLFNNLQGQFTLTSFLGPGMGASQWTALVEVGFNQIEDMPSQDELRFEAPGTARSGNVARAEFDANGNPTGLEGVETNGFADDFSWGYRAVLRAEYPDAIAGWNLTPRIIFQHDVSGNTPVPIANFIEGRKATALGVTADYLQKWKFDFSYNMFSGGGTQNLLSDRDFVALTGSYSF
ncbi:DUF1302 domain-containing protein [Pleionea sp. CnH1-48]|uniref:DUF1302 domain-containing protein n=1 Tax=Pleionea sp. CnH1-48 TaxID=2954494 RepID=UPI0020969B4D|nr:DUF1302 domain-containing protein [Pleionea sp. CnH1-48]MCO7222987.1 DUF1302 domain-containing protein [Pleionea sp. CnH1-48]